MRPLLFGLLITIGFAPQIPGLAQTPAATPTGPKVQVTFEPGGLVSLVANGATVREVLSQWEAKGGTKFNGAGGTTRTTELSATITARVTEVLPSGDLVVEAVREVNINGDRSIVVLSGVVRPADIQPGNVIPSSMVGQFRIQSLSAGLVKDSLTPGFLIRALNKVF